MTGEHANEFVAECLWPDVRESELRVLDQRVTVAAERLAAQGESVRYLGCLLMREDEVVLCQFSGDFGLVRQVADAARIPYHRILETARSPWRADTEPN
jgi:hypothetical protein